MDDREIRRGFGHPGDAGRAADVAEGVVEAGAGTGRVLLRRHGGSAGAGGGIRPDRVPAAEPRRRGGDLTRGDPETADLRGPGDPGDLAVQRAIGRLAALGRRRLVSPGGQEPGVSRAAAGRVQPVSAVGRVRVAPQGHARVREVVAGTKALKRRRRQRKRERDGRRRRRGVPLSAFARRSLWFALAWVTMLVAVIVLGGVGVTPRGGRWAVISVATGFIPA